MLIFGPQLLLYLLLFVGTVLYLAFCWTFYRHLDRRHQGIAWGLLVSPVGFVLPYVILAGISWLLYDGHPPAAVSDWPSPLGALFVAFVLLGPLVGPPAAVALVAAWYVRRRKA